jgi:hypothetical protein
MNDKMGFGPSCSLNLFCGESPPAPRRRCGGHHPLLQTLTGSEQMPFRKLMPRAALEVQLNRCACPMVRKRRRTSTSRERTWRCGGVRALVCVMVRNTLFEIAAVSTIVLIWMRDALQNARIETFGLPSGALNLLARTSSSAQTLRRTPSSAPNLTSSERRMVEPRGFEPLTPTMPLWCSTN